MILLRIALLMVALSSVGLSLPIYYLNTGQTGAQTQIDLAHTSEWTITPNVDFEFAGGRLTMKSGNSTTEVISFSLYQGVDNTGALLSQVTLTNAQFCAQVGNCSQFAEHAFLFAAPVVLTSGTTYFIELTSDAADSQSQAYFIKDSDSFVADAAGDPVDPEPVTFGPPLSSVPEPGTLSLLVLGFGLLGTRRLRRNRAQD